MDTLVNHEVWQELLSRNWPYYLAIAFFVGLTIGVSL